MKIGNLKLKIVKRGFTLIELLIVMAIIGILATVILTATNTLKQKARAVAGLNIFRSILPATVMCIEGGGSVQRPAGVEITRKNMMITTFIYNLGGNNICSDTSITDDVYPNLENTYWTYQHGINEPPFSNYPIFIHGTCDAQEIANNPCGNQGSINCEVNDNIPGSTGTFCKFITLPG